MVRKWHIVLIGLAAVVLLFLYSYFISDYCKVYTCKNAHVYKIVGKQRENGKHPSLSDKALFSGVPCDLLPRFQLRCIFSPG